MKNPEESISKVLAALRDTTVPYGMERRILHALDDRSTLRPRPRRFTPLAWRTAACGLATVAAAALFVALMPTTPHIPAKYLPSTAALQPSGRTSKNPSPATKALPATRNLMLTERPNPPRHSQVHRASTATSTRAEAAEPGNLPPPPLPLTREERLLLEITHRRPPVELAMLTPARRASQEQRERNEFDQFFAPSEAEIETEKLNNSQTPVQGKP